MSEASSQQESEPKREFEQELHTLIEEYEDDLGWAVQAHIVREAANHIETGDL